MLESTLEQSGRIEAQLESYKRLADVFHLVMSEQSLDALLECIADTLEDLLQYDTLIIYQIEEAGRILVPVLARDEYAEEILRDRAPLGRGITGWSVESREPVLANHAHLDPRVQFIPGTPVEPESLMTIPLVARGTVKGALNIYRVGEDVVFSAEEFELAKRFGDAAALALDNAQWRAELEHQAKTDSLTGLYNHRHFHERLRAELTRVSRTHDSVAVLIVDIDDFKRVNDVFSHSTGDAVLASIADLLRSLVRGSDVVCRLGGEEFAVIMPSCRTGDAVGLAGRLQDRLQLMNFEPAGNLTVSIGVAEGPEHASNPRELLACAEAAMMTAKARGKNRIVMFEEGTQERPDAPSGGRDVRSIAHLKLLQSLSGKLNRLNDVRQIGGTIANELRTLIDYHTCRVYIVENTDLVPIAFKGEMLEDGSQNLDNWTVKVGRGMTGRVAETGRPLIVPNALECEYGVHVPGTAEIEESLAVVPLCFGTRVIGVIAISKLGIDQFDEDDIRLLEVLAGHASVALENARLYEQRRREAEHALALLDFADSISKAPSLYAIGNETVRMSARLLESLQASLWLQDERAGDFKCAAHCGYVGDPTAEGIVRFVVERSAGEALIEGHNAPFIISPTETERFYPAPAGVEPRTRAVAPLHGLKGWITVRHPRVEAEHFTEEHMRLLASICYHASEAMQKESLYRDQKESAEIANALLDFSGDLTAAEGIDEVLNRTVAIAARLLSSPRTAIWLEDAHSRRLIAEAQHGFEGEALTRLIESEFDGERARPMLTPGQPFVVRPADLQHVPAALDIAGGASWLGAPILLEDGRVGCLGVAAPALGDYEFSERKVRLLRGIAHQAQLAINNAASFEGLERTFISTVEALANALEAKDEYTSSHARWITDMAIEVGLELGLDAQTLKNLELGALFHDIGKIGIPSHILMKPGPLDDEEWEIIKQHPELGEKILAPIERLTEVRTIVRHCHEHFDGGGYPDRKRGNQIPLESRIILVVDAFHAMTSDRPYRKRMSVETAFDRLREAAGSDFDPVVVDALIRVLAERGPEQPD